MWLASDSTNGNSGVAIWAKLQRCMPMPCRRRQRSSAGRAAQLCAHVAGPAAACSAVQQHQNRRWRQLLAWQSKLKYGRL